VITLTKNAPLSSLGLSSGDYLVKFHVEGDSISFEIVASPPGATMKPQSRKPTGFVQKWGGSARKIEDANDAWLSHLNAKHLR
jgi:hypothetical protein